MPPLDASSERRLWLVWRVVFVVLAVLLGVGGPAALDWFVDSESVRQAGLSDLLRQWLHATPSGRELVVSSAVWPSVLLVWIGLLQLLRRAPAPWRRPSWRHNPFCLLQPLEPLHLLLWCHILGLLGMLAAVPLVGEWLWSHIALTAVHTAGIPLAMWMFTVIYRDRRAEDPATPPAR